MDAGEKTEQQRQSLLARERALKTKTRRRENARKYRLGGMVVKAGLHELADEQIIGALLEQKARLGQDPDIARHWEALSREADLTPGKVAVVIKFTEKPAEEITKKIKAHRLRWNRITKQWEGLVADHILDELRPLVGDENIAVQPP